MVNGEEYYTRKGDYAIKGMVSCNDAVRITWIQVGCLGSVHDNQVWSNMRFMWVEIRILIRRSICLGIKHFQPQQ